jgi:hypothetical protein
MTIPCKNNTVEKKRKEKKRKKADKKIIGNECSANREELAY